MTTFLSDHPTSRMASGRTLPRSSAPRRSSSMLSGAAPSAATADGENIAGLGEVDGQTQSLAETRRQRFPLRGFS